MKTILLVLIAAVSILPQLNVYVINNAKRNAQISEPSRESVYYVDANNGDDDNNGLTPETAWKTISKVNSQSFIPGDTILFKGGCTWNETLIIPTSGNSSNHIVYGRYSYLESKPKISQRTILSDWNNSGNWTNVTTNIWRYYMPQNDLTTYLTGLWLDNKYYKRAYQVNSDNYPFDSLSFNYEDYSTYPGIDSKYRWAVLWGSNYLYLYSTTNPASYYSSIETNIRLGDDYFWSNLKADGKKYITIDGIIFEGGFSNVELSNGCKHWEIKNCEFTYSARGILMANVTSVNAQNDSNYIHNNMFDSKLWTVEHPPYHYYSNPNSGGSWLSNYQGIYLINGANHNVIYGNTIIDYPNGCITLLGIAETSFSTNYNLIDSNNIYLKTSSGRGISILQNEDYNNLVGNIICRNYIEQRQSGHYWGDSTIFIYNIYGKIQPQNQPLYLGWGEANEGGYNDDSYYGHNTINNTLSFALYSWEGFNQTEISNNLFINVSTNNSGNNAIQGLTQTYNHDQIYKNNLFFYQGKTSSSYMVFYNGNYYSVNDWNGADARTDIISGNLQHTGLLSDMIDTTTFIANTEYELNPIFNNSSAIPTWVKNQLLRKFPNGFRRRDYTEVIQSNGTQINYDIGAGAK